MAIKAPHRKPIEREETKTRLLPPYAVIVLNDDYHCFDYVIMVFQKVFGYSFQKSAHLAQEIHKRGRGIVWSGSKEVAELKKDQIESMGPDLLVDWPLRVELEPLP